MISDETGRDPFYLHDLSTVGDSLQERLLTTLDQPYMRSREWGDPPIETPCTGGFKKATLTRGQWMAPSTQQLHGNFTTEAKERVR